MIKKLLFFVSLFVLLIPKSYAIEYTPYWGYDLTHFTSGQFYNCTSSTSCNEPVTTTPQWGYDYNLTKEYPGFISSNIQTIPNSYGAMFTFGLDETLTTNYYYSIQIFMCNTSNTSTLSAVNLYGSTSTDDLTNYNYSLDLKHKVNHLNLSNQPYPSYGSSSGGGEALFPSCRAITAIFQPTSKTTIFGFQFTTNTTSSSQWFAVGYTLENLGFSNYLTSSDVNNILDNSGFATADSVEEVDQSINEVKQEIAGMEDQQVQTNEKLDDLNNNITSEDSPDTSGLSDVAGWLPPGPVDSLINLPLSLFNSISRDLSSTCTPITLPLPYVNEDLTLPCMSSFYNGIGIGDFMNWVGVISSGFILFSYLMKLYKWVDDTLTFRENNHLDNWGGV